MFSDNNNTWYNSNDFLLAVRQTVLEGKEVQPEHIIPSVYLKSMTDFYSNMKYENVVKLANRALEHSNNIEDRIKYEIQYLLFQALAKLKKSIIRFKFNHTYLHNHLTDFLFNIYLILIFDLIPPKSIFKISTLGQ